MRKYDSHSNLDNSLSFIKCYNKLFLYHPLKQTFSSQTSRMNLKLVDHMNLVYYGSYLRTQIKK